MSVDHDAAKAWDADFNKGLVGRRYLPTIAELIDRLTIVTLKSIYIPENRAAYLKERDSILHDIRLLVKDFAGAADILLWMSTVLMLSNFAIWQSESKARQGLSDQDQQLKFSHSLNAVRNHAKNGLDLLFCERVDIKKDSLADWGAVSGDLNGAFGNWNVFEAADGGK